MVAELGRGEGMEVQVLRHWALDARSLTGGMLVVLWPSLRTRRASSMLEDAALIGLNVRSWACSEL